MLPDELILRLRAFQESRVLLTAIELDLYNGVGEGGTAAEVASRVGTEPRATAMLMNALVALGMLEKTGDRFRNAPEAARYFMKSSPEDARLAMMHHVGLWNRWSTLTACVREGTSVQQQDMAARGSDWTEPFIAAMHYNASARAPEVVTAIDAAGIRRMLDVGGGSGAYSIAFAKANPSLRAEILDLDSVVTIARRHIAQAGVDQRVTARRGDLRSDDLGGPYDLVFISAICHMLGEDENRDLFRRSFRALSNSGRIVIQDFILEPDRTAPRAAALFALNMLVGTESGNTYTEREYADWLREAGFAGIRRIRLSGPAGLMLASRPA